MKNLKRTLIALAALVTFTFGPAMVPSASATLGTCTTQHYTQGTQTVGNTWCTSGLSGVQRAVLRVQTHGVPSYIYTVYGRYEGIHETSQAIYYVTDASFYSLTIQKVG